MSDLVQMVMASRLSDGRVVYAARGGRWTESIADGAVARTEAEAGTLLNQGFAGAAANLVVMPELVPVVERDGVRSPRTWRELIRARGPTVEARAAAR